MGIPDELRKEMARPDDGARHQLGKEGDVEGELPDGVHRLQLAEVDVERVAHALEGVKRDADGQEDLPSREPDAEAQAAEQRLHAGQSEVGVLEIGQDPQVAGNAAGQEDAARPQALRTADGAPPGRNPKCWNRAAGGRTRRTTPSRSSSWPAAGTRAGTGACGSRRRPGAPAGKRECSGSC